MFARQWAVFCLLLAGLSPAWAHDDGTLHHGPTIPELVVYLENAGAQSPTLLKFMQQELAVLMKQGGFHLAFREMQNGQISDADFLSVVGFSGSCAIPAGNRPVEDRTPMSPVLATTAVSDGRVLPFSAVNCTALTRLLQPALLQSAGAQRDFLYGRALARVIAHELYHVLAQTTGHTGSGIAQRSLSAAELLRETLPAGRFSLP